MKQQFSLILFLLAVHFTTAQNLNALFSFATFYTPERGAYIETYLSVDGNSVVYKQNQNGNYQASLLITLVFKQGDNIIKFNKYNLKSPEIVSDTAQKQNFLDLQRMSLPNGTYEMELEIVDENTANPPVKVAQVIEVAYPQGLVTFSDIEFFESMKKTTNPNVLTKSGYDIYPYPSSFFPENINAIGFYVELYNTQSQLQENEPFLITYEIVDYASRQTVQNFKSFKKETAAPVVILNGMFNIEKLPTGNYILKIEARDKTNKLLTSKEAFFQRKNQLSGVVDLSQISITNTFADSLSPKALNDYIQALEPIATETESQFIANQLTSNDIEKKRRFFYYFWYSRNSTNPSKAWHQYKKDLIDVEKSYATQIKHGYETDRGRIYLKYGKPNSILAKRNEPSAYPYEIWHYYRIDDFSNVKFVFYNPDLITNDYQLIHSTMFGEVNYPQWKVLVHRRTTQSQDPDLNQQQQHYGGNIDEFYNLPR